MLQIGRDALSTCQCRFGYYHPEGKTGLPCTPCPDHGNCPGGNLTATPQRGYWASTENPFTFFSCEFPDACPGGKLEACNQGYAILLYFCYAIEPKNQQHQTRQIGILDPAVQNVKRGSSRLAVGANHAPKVPRRSLWPRLFSRL